MNKIAVLLISAVALQAVGFGAPSKTYASFPSLVQQAELIAIGTMQSTNNGSTGTGQLRIDTILKGNLTPLGSEPVVQWAIRSVPLVADGGAGATRVYARHGLFFLRRSGDRWRPASVVEGAAGWGDSFYPMPPDTRIDTTVGSSTVEKVMFAITAAIEYFDGKRGYGLVAISAFPVDSPLSAQLFRRLAESSADGVRVIGLSCLIRQGDVNALRSAADQLPLFADMEGRVALTEAVSSFRGVNPMAVQALSDMVRSPASNRDWYMDRAAAYALFAIHSTEALPVLVQLLDHADATIRGWAMGGLSAYALGLPVINDEKSFVEDLDLRTNPNWRSVSSVPVPHHHFGPFSGDAEERQEIEYWKRWWAERH